MYGTNLKTGKACGQPYLQKWLQLPTASKELAVRVRKLSLEHYFCMLTMSVVRSAFLT